jgi:hypothetical protein
MTSLRLALIAAVVPLLSACTAIVPVEVAQEVTLASPGGDFATSQVVDLSTQPSVWSRRNSVDAVSVDEITATVVSLGTGHLASSVSLDLAFRADGAPADGSQDLRLGTLSGLPFAVGASVRLPGSAALDAFLLDALQGSGKFTALATGNLTGAANAVLELSLKGSAAVKVGGK